VAWAEAYFRTKWRLHPSSRLATRYGQKIGWVWCVLFSKGSWVPIKHEVTWAEAYLHTKWHLSPSSHLTTKEIGRKLGLCPLREGGAGSPYNTMSRRPREAYLRTKRHLYPCSRLATIDVGRKLGTLPLFGKGVGLGPHLTKSRMG